MQSIQNSFESLDASLTNFLSNPYVSVGLTVLVAIFAALAAANMSPNSALANLFNNDLFVDFAIANAG